MSIVQRGALKDVIQWAAAHQTGVIVYSPMASGLLSGSFDRDRLASLASDDMRLRRPEFTEPALSQNLALIERLRALAERLGATVAELAIAWTLAQEGVTGAIVGARRPSQLDQWIGAGNIHLQRRSPRDRRRDRADRCGNRGAPDAAPAVGGRERARGDQCAGAILNSITR
jgi:aryl-alcohol dehydrogenase-like predicted oxidoreductase